jgi:hypothetical protein
MPTERVLRATSRNHTGNQSCQPLQICEPEGDIRNDPVIARPAAAVAAGLVQHIGENITARAGLAVSATSSTGCCNSRWMVTWASTTRG